MPHDDDTPPRTQNEPSARAIALTDPAIEDMVDRLTHMMRAPLPGGSSMLSRQAEEIDAMFAALMIDHIETNAAQGKAISDEREKLELVLRVQKQAMDTARTAAAIDYMRTITPALRLSPARKLNDPALLSRADTTTKSDFDAYTPPDESGETN